MKIRRTANAGVFLEMDETTILLDGICGEVVPYLKTPDEIKTKFCKNPPDAVLFTHKHKDHFDESYAEYLNNNSFRSVYGPESLYSGKIGNIEVISIETRHIGKTDIMHCSFVLEGSKNIWFMGDASPNELKKFGKFKAPDIFIAPYAYAISDFAWKKTKSLGANAVVLVHLPDIQNDPYGLWNEVKGFTSSEKNVYVPDINEILIFD